MGISSCGTREVTPGGLLRELNCGDLSACHNKHGGHLDMRRVRILVSVRTASDVLLLRIYQVI